MTSTYNYAIPPFDVLLVDADSLIYSIAWNTFIRYTELSPEEMQKKAEERLTAAIDTIIEALEVPKVTHVFVKGKDNFRYKISDQYKAHRRKEIDPKILERINKLYEYAQGIFTCADNGEADDYCSIYTHKALEDKKIPVVAHIDKDLNMIPGWHYNFTHQKLYFTSPQDSFVFMCTQLLTGDYSDNIPGIRGVGIISARKLLANKLLSEFKDEILRIWEYKTKDKNWKEEFLKSANCLILRESFDELRELTEKEILKKMSWTLTKERYMDTITNNLSVDSTVAASSIKTPIKEGKPKKVVYQTSDNPEALPLPVEKERVANPILCVNTGEIFPTITAAGKQLSIPFYTLVKVLDGRQKEAKGLSFKYVEKEN